MSTTHTAPTTIAAERGIDCNAAELVRLLTCTGIAAEIGLRELVDCGDGIMGRVGIRGQHKLIVKLNSLDLFDVELGHLRRFDWIVDRQSRNVAADQLSTVIRSLAEGVLR